MTLALKITLTTFIGSVMLAILTFHFWAVPVGEWSKKFLNILHELFSSIAIASFAGIFICIIWNIGR